MKAVGIIAEFNPFHNGHAYLLKEAKKKSGADCVICVMSGHFVQRGAGAVYNKWSRAQKALENGADLVIELPVSYVLQSAEGFAFGGIYLLKALGVSSVAFGTETHEDENLLKTATFLSHPPSSYTEKLKELLSTGLGYATAQAEAIKDYPFAVSMTPNNILALSYIKEGIALDFSPDWISIPRVGAYHDEVGSGNYSSASHIRELLEEKKYEIAKAFLPNSPQPIELNRPFLEAIALANLRRMSQNELSEISGVSEGLENRIYTAANQQSFDAFLEATVTKRYPASRIRRITYAALLGITQKEASTAPSYLRILGMNRFGQQYLKEKSDEFSLPLITKTADASLSKMLEKDILATDLWALASKNTLGKQDYLTSPIVMK